MIFFIFRKKFLRIFFGSLLILYALFVALFAYLFLGSPEVSSSITWGVNFSHTQALDQGLDWQETYLAILDDLGVRDVRIPIYWDELEAEQGQYDFSNWDWQIEQLARRDGRVILAIGFKLPRWPECRFPSWLESEQSIDRDKRLFQMIRTVVAHYRDNPTVIAWQVENEPLLTFGICPEADPGLLDAEIELVRRLDPSRPIIITDTGEFSFWIEAGKRADILGSTLYRIIHDPTLGFVEYNFINPTSYARKARILHLWRPDVKVIVTELQAEPWVLHLPIASRSLEEQNISMNPEQFRDNIDFARRTGFDTFYLWGAEWWYWMKTTQGQDEIWEEARPLFKE